MENIFPEQLKIHRKKNNFTQEEVAKKLYVSRQAASKWESGDVTPDLNNLITLCKIFDCDLNDLVFGIKKEKSREEEITGYIWSIGIILILIAIFI
ncbi:XRE family transcriptional regulator [Apilactobacillus timberlakei]|uniref:helix-turn-helix transcriptional regulator n=1 Tax=Apilactobacillus timberlakei TaxID=2008380 RepID=UPI00112C3835|nr:helix-turn-helix transcriptional regulator [Apilactobacillus timberlakei]TPR19652.1 XRE family transcriptional regulator [Apilactobacillus timberlakei]TPR20629.1 XRE family transcriptional regulator [Apilactobacillus timberlakei]TPR22672.1 XRE family transcriptional regulator [Apilactobacillus timberlakei]